MDVEELDPFDLPDWLGTGQVTWRATSSLTGGHVITGELSGAGGSLPCDLVAADLAFPAPVLEEHWRGAVHRLWTYDEVLLVRRDGRLALAVPGTDFTADRALEALRRLAKAVGAGPDNFVAALRL